MSLTGFLFRTATQKPAQRFEVASRDARGTQRALLMSMVQRNANTEYGKKYGFGEIRNEDDWRERVPIVTYEDIKEDMVRVTEGAKNVFTAEDPLMFAQTSGTTGDPKFVPVTASCRGEAHGDVMRTWFSHAQQAHPDIFDRKIVSLVSPAIEGYSPSGLPFGSTSGHMYKHQNWLVRRAYPVAYEVFEIEDYQSKYYAIMRSGVEHDVRFVATANPSSILKMCEKADELSDDIIKDIHDGTLSREYDIADEIRVQIQKSLKRNPARAKALETMRSRRDGRLLPGDYWQKLSLIGCWKGGTVGHYLDKFGGWFDPDGRRAVPVRDWGYLSSEVRGSIPLSDEGSQGALTIAGNYFEFVEVDDLESNRDDYRKWTVLGASEIQQGREYYIFVTTTAGLYRYDINDIIQVTGAHHTTPQIVFLRKGRGMTNITGEKVSVNQVIDSVQKASQSTGVLPSHFKAEADTDAGRYLFRIEFATKVPDAERGTFLEAIDHNLKDINIEYKAKRDSMRLHPPVMHVMKDGWYERSRRKQAAAGKRVFQAKTEVLSPNRLQTMKVKSDLEAVVEMKE